MIFEHESAPPSGPKFAEGMTYSPKFMLPLVQNLVHLEACRTLPDMTQITRFYIYTLSKDMRTTGNRIVLKTISCNYFVLELICSRHFDGRPRLYLNVDSYRENEDDLVFRGRIWDSGLGLIYCAINLIDRLSYYLKFKHNAMRFSEKFLTLLGIGFYKCLLDHERIILMAYGLSAAEVLLDLFFKTPRPLYRTMTSQITCLERAFF